MFQFALHFVTFSKEDIHLNCEQLIRERGGFRSAPSTHFNLENKSSLPTLAFSVFSNGDAVIARRSVADLDPALAHVRIDRVISSGGRINDDIRAAGITVALDGQVHRLACTEPDDVLSFVVPSAQ